MQRTFYAMAWLFVVVMWLFNVPWMKVTVGEEHDINRRRHSSVNDDEDFAYMNKFKFTGKEKKEKEEEAKKIIKIENEQQQQHQRFRNNDIIHSQKANATLFMKRKRQSDESICSIPCVHALTGCCVNGTRCCGSRSCCKPTHQCCGGGCCAPGFHCCEQIGCCRDGQVCLANGACMAEQTWDSYLPLTLASLAVMLGVCICSSCCMHRIRSWRQRRAQNQLAENAPLVNFRVQAGYGAASGKGLSDAAIANLPLVRYAKRLSSSDEIALEVVDGDSSVYNDDNDDNDNVNSNDERQLENENKVFAHRSKTASSSSSFGGGGGGGGDDDDDDDDEAAAKAFLTETCCICLDDFVEGEQVPMLPRCGHIFHAQCISQWLGDNDRCPLCVQKVQD